ncbi:hypothetical protein [Sphingomonas desiccabilis]|uniref:Uncharacterized protein n=1 Tax=Sphingomonas desiccabilis TaxID=429134 RepID=A0A4V1QP49_9SPHN|nr:hypothetical protein [Sphingomonas desiccabilis]MBB3911281.1 hypothetical protein [Sphingomonas desiccabilis]RXZ31924.1 hypothetical protein EO081_12105 [Sphingomonas desiccabilis]
MTKAVPMLMLPLVALLGACGGGEEVRVTNDENVVLNDSYDNMAFSNDGEDPANAVGSAGGADGAMMDNGTGGNMTMPAGNETLPIANDTAPAR